MNRYRPYFPVLGLLLLYILSRWLALRQAGSFWFDEVFSVHFASLPLSEMWGFLRFEHNPLLHFIALKTWMGVFGNSETAARLLSVLFGAGTLVALIIAGKRLYSQRAGLYAGGFMIASSFMLYHQTEARMYALMGMLAAILIALAWTIRQRRFLSRPLFVGYVAVGTLLAHTHLTAWNLLLALVVYWFAEYFSGQISVRKMKQALLAHGIMIATVIPWLIPVARNKLMAGGVAQGWFFTPSTDGFFLTHLTNAFVSGETGLFVRAATVAFVLVLLSTAVLRIDKPDWWQKVRRVFDRETWPFSLELRLSAPTRFLLTLIMAQTFVAFALQITVTKYVLTALIPLLLLLAHGLDQIRSTFMRAVVAVVFIALVAPMHVRLYTQQRHHWDQVARDVVSAQNRLPGSVTLVHSYANTLLLQQYMSKADMRRVIPVYPERDQLTLEERIVRYNWQPVIDGNDLNFLRAPTRRYDYIILVASTAGESERDPVKAWLWQNGWTLQEEMSYKGYGDPEVLILRRGR